jgi:hypothetical protein
LVLTVWDFFDTLKGRIASAMRSLLLGKDGCEGGGKLVLQTLFQKETIPFTVVAHSRDAVRIEL